MKKRELRVVIVSPGDVMAERDEAENVCHQITALYSETRGIILAPIRWETHTYPIINGKGPQIAIDPALKIEEADLVIGIINMRLGTPTKSAASGTVHELRKAIAARGRQGGPVVMVYFRNLSGKRGATARGKGGTQVAAVRRFRRELQKLGLLSDYRNVAEFSHLVTLHVLRFLEGRYSQTGSFVWGSNDGWRIDNYQSLRGRAKKKIRVLGIGACNVTRHHERILSALENGIDFELLIVDPDYFESLEVVFRTETGFTWDQYFCTDHYIADIRSSIRRAGSIALKQRPQGRKVGTFSVRVYRFFLPWNITIADGSGGTKGGELLVEYCIPGTDMRLGKHIMQKHDAKLFAKYSDYFAAIWQRATPIVADIPA